MVLPVAYVVRVYRFPGRGRGRVVGTLQSIGSGEVRSFRNARELWTAVVGMDSPVAAVEHPSKPRRKT